MNVELKVPKVSEEGKSGVIVRWYKNNGDNVREGEEVAEVMVEKITAGVQASKDGKLKMGKKKTKKLKKKKQ